MPSYRHFAERDDNGDDNGWRAEVSILPTRRFGLFFAALLAIAGENLVGRARKVSTVVKLSYCLVGRFTGTGEPTPFVSRTAPLQKRFDPLVVLWLARTQITRRYSIAAECAYTYIFFIARPPQMRTGVFSYFQSLVRVKFYSLPKQPDWGMNSCAVCGYANV